MRKILDEDIKYSGPRTCPNCGYQFPFELFARRFVMALGLSKWNCHKCGQTIKCDFIKIQILWSVGIVACGIFTVVLLPYFSLELLTIVSLILYLIYVLSVLYYIEFEEER